MTKRMRKQTYQWYQCSGEGTHCSAAAAMKEVTQWRQWWRKSLLNGSDSVWSTNLLIGEGDFGEGGQIGVMVQPQENDSCWFSFFLRKLCPCSIKIQKKIEEEDQGVERERWRRILGRRCEKGNPCRSWYSDVNNAILHKDDNLIHLFLLLIRTVLVVVLVLINSML